MKQIRLGLIGFGNVGQGLAQILLDYGSDYRASHDVQFIITAVADRILGCMADTQGLNLNLLLDKAAKDKSFKGLAQEKPDWDALRMIRESSTDVIVEMSYTDLKTGEPATTHIREALKLKKHVVTTNKGPVALHYDELEKLALQNGVKLEVEGTVMSGTPTLHLGRDLLAGAKIRSIKGILNGTTNFILTKMENGDTYEAALAEAQALGYAEADPSGDVEGFDAAGKVVIMARLLMNETIRMEDVNRSGITHLKPEDIASARAAGERWKLIGTLLREDDGKLAASVKVERLPLNHPLAGVSGATNAVHFTTDLLGEVTLIGPGAGRLPTGYAVIEDLLSIL